MNTIELKSWEEFLDHINKLQLNLVENKKRYGYVSKYLFRGQPNSDFELLSTLERATKKRISLIDYYRTIGIIKGQIESFTGNKISFPTYLEVENHLKHIDTFLAGDSLVGYEYMIYLRHHGFPSPLLDWTFSSYIAAFFCIQRRV